MKAADVAVEIRPAQSGDEAALAALDALVNPSPWTVAQFAGACRPPAEGGAERALVVAGNGGPCGFIVFSRVLEEACIHNIAVHPARQGGGLGRLLLDTVLQQEAASGACLCYLEVRSSNSAARGLYRSLGFGLDGVRRNYYRTATGREDALLMSRRLTQGNSRNERA